MKRPIVKICGITNAADAHLCLESGADILGFIFYDKSSRNMTAEKAGSIIRSLKKDISFTTAGVFVNPEREFVIRTAEISGIDLLQFHGDESPAFIDNFQLKKIKAFRIKEKADIDICEKYDNADFFLLDTFSKDSYGGTGKVFNWDYLRDFKHRDRLFLSGGLNAGNIIRALDYVEPYAVDLSSGLEKEPGIKDAAKVMEFFRIIDELKEIR